MWSQAAVVSCIFTLCWAGMPPEVLKDLSTPIRYLGEGCGYDSCPTFKKDGLNIHLVPHTHAELGLTSFFDRHFTGNHPGFEKNHLMSMKNVLDSTITHLWNNPLRRFTLSDLPYFFHWWSKRDETIRRMVYQLLRQNRLTLVGGGWGMPDEATTNYQAVIDQHTYTLRKLNATFLDCGRPIVAWQSDCAGHSREFASLYAQMGYDGIFLSPISHDDELTRMGQKAFEFVWRGSDDLGRESDIFAHKLFDGFSCPPGFCFGGGHSDPLIVSSDGLFKNIDDRAIQFIDIVKHRQGPNYRSNHVMIVMGGRFAYYDAEIWFRNIERLMRRVNELAGEKHLGVVAFYSTPACYLKAVHDSKPTLPVKQDDFFPHQENPDTYATGLYTSVPAIKYMVVEGNVYMQMTKQLQVLAKLTWGVNDVRFEELHWIMGVMQDHTVMTGELTHSAYSHYSQKMYLAVQRATLIMKDGINKLRGCQKTEVYYRCSFNESSCPPVNRFGAHIVVYNPLAWPVTLPVRLPVLKGSQMVVYDPKGEEVKASLTSIPELVLRMPGRATVADDELVFLAEELPPLGFRSYYIARFYLRRLKRGILKKQSRNKAQPTPAPAQASRASNQASPASKQASQTSKQASALSARSKQASKLASQTSKQAPAPSQRESNEETDSDDLKVSNREVKQDNGSEYTSDRLAGKSRPVLKWDPELVPGFESRRRPAAPAGPPAGPPNVGAPGNVAEDTRRFGSGDIMSPDAGSLSDLERAFDRKVAAEGTKPFTGDAKGPFSDYSDYGGPKRGKPGGKPARPKARDPFDDYYEDEDYEETGTSTSSRPPSVDIATTSTAKTVEVKKERVVLVSNASGDVTMPPFNSLTLEEKKRFYEIAVSHFEEAPLERDAKEANTTELPRAANSTALPREVLARLQELEEIKRQYKTEQIVARKTLYNYEESPDDFIENQYVKLFVNRSTGHIKSMTLSSQQTISLDIGFFYYESDDPVALGKKLIPPGAYVFRPLDTKPQKVGTKIGTKIYKTPVVQEIHMVFDTYAGLTLRLYNHRSVLELDWLVGPLESDYIGKEVFLRYATDLRSEGVFYTDANGRQTVKRIRGQRPMYIVGKPDAVAGNFYPVTSKIYIEDAHRKLRFAVLNDRSQGGSSLEDGSIELMLHRRILTADSVAAAFLNETEYGQPVRVRGKHYVYLTASDQNQFKVFEKKLAKEIALQPQVFAAHSLSKLADWRSWRNEFTGVANKLPLGVHLLTLQEWGGHTLLVRLEHYLERADVAEGLWTRRVHLKYLFSNIIITSVNEMTLGANRFYRDWAPLEWRRETEFVRSFNEHYGKSGSPEFRTDEALRPIGQTDLDKGLELEPQQIRTFVATFVNRD